MACSLSSHYLAGTAGRRFTVDSGVRDLHEGCHGLLGAMEDLAELRSKAAETRRQLEEEAALLVLERMLAREHQNTGMFTLVK